MRFPWQKRADAEKRHREAAERRLRRVEADWPDIRRTAYEALGEAVLNGWTEAVREVWGAPKREKKR